jgi:hypothetical protein
MIVARKVYVKVVAEFDTTGKVRPISIEWEDGHVYAVDKLIDTRMAASTKVGGQGTRYTCRICGHEAFLFQDEQRWFMEAKDADAV